MTAAALAPQEHRLRPTAGLRGTPAVALSAWKGRSGRRYVVGVYDLIEPTTEEMGEAVVLAVSRDKSGIAQAVLVSTISDRPGCALPRSWLSDARKRGATELHCHRLCENDAERAAAAEDLRP